MYHSMLFISHEIKTVPPKKECSTLAVFAATHV